MLLVLTVVMSLFACSDDTSTDESSDAIDTSESIVLSTEEALSLVERDREVIELFICGSLYGGWEEAVSTPLPDGHEYAEFSAVESLLSSTYVASEYFDDTSEALLSSTPLDDKWYFLSYPSIRTEKSLSNVDGRTHVFYHAGSSFEEFIDPSTVSVSATADDNKKLIWGKTASGTDVSLTAVYDGATWKLEHSLCRSLNDGVNNGTLPMARDKGSMSKLESGTTLVIELFVSDGASKFSDADEQEFHSRIEKALGYISTAANRHGREITWDYNSSYGFHHSGVMGTRAMDFDIVFAETGFGTLRNFAEANYPVDEYDNYLIFVCMNKDAELSYGRFDGRETTEIYYGERVIVGQNTTPEELSRAVLSLCGADDPTYDDPYLTSLYRRYFPYDIMVSDPSSAKFDEVTMYSCGMLDRLTSIYRVFIKE